MSQMPGRNPVITVKPQPNIYTLLVIVAIIMLAVGLGLVLHNLMVDYGLSFSQVFDPRSIELPR
jgi:hypothetical protein